jgi:hypothetical protein
MTTTTIANRCHDEELVTADRLYRIQCLELQIEAGLPSGEAQLACESIKFHQIRMAGFDVQAALVKMGVA